MKSLTLLLIRFYQLAISPWLGQKCRYLPSCSEYTKESIETFGICKGSWLGAKRVCRCHPFAKGGFDPVPKKKA